MMLLLPPSSSQSSTPSPPSLLGPVAVCGVWCVGAQGIATGKRHAAIYCNHEVTVVVVMMVLMVVVLMMVVVLLMVVMLLLLLMVVVVVVPTYQGLESLAVEAGKSSGDLVFPGR